MGCVLHVDQEDNHCHVVLIKSREVVGMEVEAPVQTVKSFVEPHPFPFSTRLA